MAEQNYLKRYDDHYPMAYQYGWESLHDCSRALLAEADAALAEARAEIERLKSATNNVGRMNGQLIVQIAALEAQLAEAREVVGRWPKYADTGEPLMPGMIAHWRCGAPGHVASYCVTEVRLYEPEPDDDTEWEPHEWPHADAWGVPADGSVSHDGNGGFGPLGIPDDFGIFSTEAAARAAAEQGGGAPTHNQSTDSPTP